MTLSVCERPHPEGVFNAGAGKQRGCSTRTPSRRGHFARFSDGDHRPALELLGRQREQVAVEVRPLSVYDALAEVAR